MGKLRVGTVVRDAMGSKSSNRSADLDQLAKQYSVWCKNIKVLVQSLGKQYKAMLYIDQTRGEVAKTLTALTTKTPLFDVTGLMPSSDRPVDSVHSYASTHDQLSAKMKSFADKFKTHVLDYTIEWEKVVRTRIDNGLKKAEELRRDLDHYQKKTESLRLSVNQAMAKGKNVKSEQQERLKRNEEKLINAKQNYNKVATDLCILMEEITERSWRDLHPLLVKCIQFDMTAASDEARILGSMSTIISQLRQIANDQGISPQHRLKDMGNLKPELLSTRPGGVAGMAIEADLATSAFGMPSTQPSEFNNALSIYGQPPPSAEAPVGYPVPVGQPLGGSGAKDFSRSNSLGSYYSQDSNPPSTLDMLNISKASAPPPTLEDVYSSSYAPSSGGLPPLPPSDASVGGSSQVSAPPAAPPPPPPGAQSYGSPVPAPFGNYPSAPSSGGYNNYSLAPVPSSGGFGGYPPAASPPGGYGGPPPPSPTSYGAPPPGGPTSPVAGQWNQPNPTNPFG